MAARLNITGRGGKNLREAWANDNPTAYLGLTVPDFPNLLRACSAPMPARRMAAA